MSVRMIAARRNSKGASSMAEFGPAMLILLVFFFFPLIDMLALGVSYGLVRTLNYNQAHEAALVPYQDAEDPNGYVQKGIPEKWGSGMGHFVKVAGNIGTKITYKEGQSGGEEANADKTVTVTTTVTCSPFLPIPLPGANIPGLSGPMTFQVATDCPMENPDYAGKIGGS